MKQLYTPWRMKYIESKQEMAEGCVFCAKIEADADHDRENYVVYRGESAFVIMNIYPYNTGHLMILPHQHVADLTAVEDRTQAEIMHLAAYFTNLLREVMQPDGFNLGINLGRSAGAGLGSHLHMHIVPRWANDNNFMSVVGETRVLPETLDDTYDKIMAAVQKSPPK